jgi:PTH1 family peptidyl-tRNA hydrolase
VDDFGGVCWLVAGLGNPGRAYAGTRHNVGFAVVERLAAASGVTFGPGAFQSLVARIELGGAAVLLLEPLAFMNRSGFPVASWLARLDLPAAKLLVVHDDLDLPLGRIRAVAGAGSGGHRGVASIQAVIGTQEFPRIRVGIGRPAGDEAATDRVLTEFAPAELNLLGAVLDRAVAAVQELIRRGPDAAMNRCNVRAVPGEGLPPADGNGDACERR